MARKHNNEEPGEPEPEKPARPRGIASLAALTDDPQFIDEHDAHLDELMIAIRHFARDCFDRVDDEFLPPKRARLAKSGLELTLGYTRVLKFQESRRKAARGGK